MMMEDDDGGVTSVCGLPVLAGEFHLGPDERLDYTRHGPSPVSLLDRQLTQHVRFWMLYFVGSTTSSYSYE